MIQVTSDAVTIEYPPRPKGEPPMSIPEMPEGRLVCRYCGGQAILYRDRPFPFDAERDRYYCQKGCRAAELMAVNSKEPR